MQKPSSTTPRTAESGGQPHGGQPHGVAAPVAATIPAIPPDWKLPPGVDRALWQYLHSTTHADSYDTYLAQSPLASADVRLVFAFADPARDVLIDLGCGTGRMLEAWGMAGGTATGVDLSGPMLAQAQAKLDQAKLSQAKINQVNQDKVNQDKGKRELLAHEDAHKEAESIAEHRPGLVPFGNITLSQGNLTTLSDIPEGHFDRACCLYSTLGMIRTQSARAQALKSFHRVLKPGGLLLVHAHNLGSNLWHPGGRRFLLGNLWGLVRGNDAARDFINPTHQGLSRLALHMYSRGELARALRQAGFAIEQIQALDASGHPLKGWRRALAPGLCAAGWFAVARKV